MSVAALRVVEPAQAASPPATTAERAVRDIAERFGRLGIEITDISGRIGDVTRELEGQTDGLHRVVSAMEQVSRANRGIQQAAEGAQETASVVRSGLNAAQSDIEALSEGAHSLSQALADAVADAHKVRASSDAIQAITREIQLLSVNAGVEAARSGAAGRGFAVIAAAMDTAAEIGALFEQALARGEITPAELFDEAYQPIPGSDPLQYMTRFVALTDRLLPSIQETLLGSNARIVFCAAVDRNGFLPTHNRKYAQPQGHDPVWNNANCRNRRLFDDRTGLAAARNRKPFLLQTYRRDMGGGEFLVMEDLSAPIMVRGRHWGGFRFGLKA